ncbi:hypothetical protein DXB01_04810 [Clostridium sp. OF10-22XD]|nr:hypothetical protein DXB01_04810 [Clostridium sp. OF10-22XD]
MALYSTLELLQRISEIISDGYTCCEIDQIPADDSDTEFLTFSVPIDDFGAIDYDDVDSHSDVFFDSTQKVSTESPVCAFSLSEIAVIQNGLLNAIEFGKEELKKSDLNRDTISFIKSMNAKSRNILAKIEKIFANFQ